MNEEERIREEIENTINKYACGAGSDDEDSINQWYEDYETEILSIKGIRIEADNQDKPQNPYAEAADRGDMHAQSRCSGYYCAQDDMLTPKDGYVWVKCKVKEE